VFGAQFVGHGTHALVVGFKAYPAQQMKHELVDAVNQVVSTGSQY